MRNIPLWHGRAKYIIDARFKIVDLKCKIVDSSTSSELDTTDVYPSMQIQDLFIAVINAPIERRRIYRG